MKNSRKHAKQFRELVGQLADQFEIPAPHPVDPMAQLIIGFLMADASASLAGQAFDKIRAQYIDYNELRATLPAELVALLGKRYPQAQIRAERLLATLNSLFQKENRIALPDNLLEREPAQIKSYFLTLRGMTIYVYGQIMLLAFEKPILPVDEKLRTLLVKHDIIDPAADLEEIQRWASAQLRHVKPSPRAVHLILQGWVEEQSHPAGLQHQ